VGYYVAVEIALHFLEPEYDPRFRFMSEYAWGQYGWLMTTTFFVLGLALVTVAVGIRELYGSSRSARIGFGLLVVGALGVSFAGVFREFILHSVGSAVGLPSIVGFDPVIEDSGSSCLHRRLVSKFRLRD
jgi:hypothetical membrane protein